MSGAFSMTWKKRKSVNAVDAVYSLMAAKIFVAGLRKKRGEIC